MDIVSLNNLTVKGVMFICDKPERTVYKWLSNTQKPNGLELLKLHTALITAGGKIPRELNRLNMSYKNRAHQWARENKITDKPQLIGEKIQNKQRPAMRFIYLGKECSVKEIAAANGKKKRGYLLYGQRADQSYGCYLSSGKKNPK